MVRLGRVTVLVRDVDESKGFYADAFGFETLFDEEIDGGFRAVHVGSEGIRGAGLWLMPATGTP
ncbi:MAG TPA: VOC family protein [Thermomicrobiales bacterium]|nr:VOC family protein [Thermomicrobiales bacterium]